VAPLPPLSDEKRAFNYYPSASIGFSSMRAKRTLVLVCKSWRKLAAEFLYEFIWIWKPTELFSLLRSLKLQMGTDLIDEDARNPGRYVKCLWLSMGAFAFADSFLSLPKVNKDFEELFSLCHDLQILRVWPASSSEMSYPAITE
jgi:hypothetical protein